MWLFWPLMHVFPLFNVRFHFHINHAFCRIYMCARQCLDAWLMCSFISVGFYGEEIVGWQFSDRGITKEAELLYDAASAIYGDKKLCWMVGSLMKIHCRHNRVLCFQEVKTGFSLFIWYIIHVVFFMVVVFLACGCRDNCVDCFCGCYIVWWAILVMKPAGQTILSWVTDVVLNYCNKEVRNVAVWCEKYLEDV